MTKLIEVSGLGKVSRHKAAQIEICDEMGAAFEFWALDAVRRISAFTEKEVRQALHTLQRVGTLQQAGTGMYAWRLS